MKRIKTVNGYAIYQAMSQRDADNYNCEVGCFNLYISADIRDYGLANSYPEYENIDSLAAALELANGSNYAIASALAEELSDSTIQDMDLVMEIERRLDAGETVEQITEAYDTEEQCFIDNAEEDEYVVNAYHIGLGETGEIGTVMAKNEDDAWMKGYGLAMEKVGYEPDSVTVDLIDKKEDNNMIHSNDTYAAECTITRNRSWGSDTVRDACIRNDLYTCGGNEAYSAMLDMVERTEPTTKAMYLVAKDIQEHSEDQTITNVMYILEREAVITTFEIDGSDMI